MFGLTITPGSFDRIEHREPDIVPWVPEEARQREREKYFASSGFATGEWFAPFEAESLPQPTGKRIE